LSEGCFREYGPEGGAAAYEAICKAVNAKAKPVGGGEKGSRAARNFPALGNLPAYMCVIDPVECASSQRDAKGKGEDRFSAELGLYNTSAEPYLLTGLTVEWRLVGEKMWHPASKVLVQNHPRFVPVRAHPLDCTAFKLQFGIPMDGPKSHWGSRGRSLVASKAPIRFRVTIKDLDGGSVSQVLEFVNESVKMESAADEDALFVYADNTAGDERSYVHCTIRNDDNLYVYAGSSYIDVERLQKLAGQACSQKVSEISVSDLSSSSSAYKIDVNALVDKNCQRVWALKVEVSRTDCESSNFGLMMVPLYGKTTPTRPVSVVPPTVSVPETKSSESKTKGADDDDYDNVAANHVRQLRPTPPSSTVVLLQSIERQLGLLLAQTAKK
jgi:hypothetical protein